MSKKHRPPGEMKILNGLRKVDSMARNIDIELKVALAGGVRVMATADKKDTCYPTPQILFFSLDKTPLLTFIKKGPRTAIKALIISISTLNTTETLYYFVKVILSYLQIETIE
jgi:hypothetical protein